MNYHVRTPEDEKRYQFAKSIGITKKYASIGKQVYIVNGKIFEMRKMCREKNIKLEAYKPFIEFKEEAVRRYTMYGYKYDGNRFIKST